MAAPSAEAKLRALTRMVEMQTVKLREFEEQLQMAVDEAAEWRTSAEKADARAAEVSPTSRTVFTWERPWHCVWPAGGETAAAL